MIGKFRAWSITGKRMYNWEQIIQNPQMMYKFLLWPDVYIPMWWTGLSDKDKTEIYDKDVVMLTQSDHYWVYEIKQLGGQFGNILFGVLLFDNVSIEEETGFYTYQKTTQNAGCRAYVPSGKNTKVIGNAIENPELLEGLNETHI